MVIRSNGVHKDPVTSGWTSVCWALHVWGSRPLVTFLVNCGLTAIAGYLLFLKILISFRLPWIMFSACQQCLSKQRKYGNSNYKYNYNSFRLTRLPTRLHGLSSLIAPNETALFNCIASNTRRPNDCVL